MDFKFPGSIRSQMPNFMNICLKFRWRNVQFSWLTLYTRCFVLHTSFFVIFTFLRYLPSFVDNNFLLCCFLPHRILVIQPISLFPCLVVKTAFQFFLVISWLCYKIISYNFRIIPRLHIDYIIFFSFKIFFIKLFDYSLFYTEHGEDRKYIIIYWMNQLHSQF